MAIFTVTERRHMRRGRVSEDDRTASRVFIVQSDVAVNDPFVIRAVTGVPPLAAAWVTEDFSDTFLRVIDHEPVQLSDTTWDVTVQYETLSDIPAGFIGENPLEKTPEVDFDFIDSEEEFDADIDGIPYLNAALEPFDPPVSRAVSDFRLIFQRNEANFTGSFAKKFKDTVNSDTFVGLEPGTWRLTGIKAKRQIEAALTFYRVTYTFDGRDRGPSGIHLIPSIGAGGYTLTETDFPGGVPPWRKRKLNQGLRERIGTLPEGEPEFRQFTDTDGNLLTDAALLTTAGLAAKATDAPRFILFRDFPEVAFAPLGIVV